MLCDQCKNAFSSAYQLAKGNSTTGAQPALIPSWRVNNAGTGLVQYCEKCARPI